MSTVRSLLEHLRAAKGVALVLSVGLAAAAVLVGGDLGRGFALVAVLIGAIVLLALSAELTAQRRRIAELERPSGQASGAHQGSSRSRDEPRQAAVAVAPSPVVSEEWSETARAALLRVPSVASEPGTLSQKDRPAEPHDGPLVTVVIPCFNEERFLADAIRSVLQQSVADWEIIVVDDASSDSSPRIANSFAAQDERIIVVRHKVNGGLSAARNTGLRLARGRYVTFLDGDDLLTRDSLQDRVVTLGSNMAHDVVGSYCGVRLAPEDVTLDEQEDRYRWGGGRHIDFISSRGQCPFNAHAPLCRTTVLRAAGGFDESMRDGAEDWDMWSRLLRAGFRFVPATSATAIYRQKQGSMVRAKMERHVEESEQLLARAYRVADPSTMPIRTESAFERPLHEYEQDVKHTGRVLRSAAIALVGGDAESARALTGQLSSVTPTILRHHATVEAGVFEGTRRLFGLEPRDVRGLGAELTAAVSVLESFVVESVPGVTEELAVGPCPSWDVVAVPANAADAVEMLRLAAKARPEQRWVFLDVSRTSGDQGASAVLRDADAEVRSLNEWVLQRCVAGAIVVTGPRLSVVDELVREAGDEVPVFDLVLEGRDVMTVDGLPSRLDVDSFGPDGAAERLVAVRAPDTDRPIWSGRSRAPEVAWAREEYPATRFDEASLERFRDLHKGERVCIIGNGPSLNDLDLTLLRDEATIGVNGIFYKTDEIGLDLLYYVVEDTAVMDDNLERIRGYRARGHRFFPSIYRDKVGESDDTTFFMMNRGFYAKDSPDYCVPRFSTDVRQRVFTGQSVTIINLQLAYWMGFSEVVLIGMDFSYTVPDDAQVEGDLITSAGDDPNHFHPDYFGKGKVWKDPKLDRVLANYALAKRVYEADGRRIVNATAGGRLQLFDRVPFDDLYR